MKHPFHSRILPWFTLCVGGLGLALQCWLSFLTDEKGLLPAGHPAEYALLLLTAVTLFILFLATRKLTSRHIRGRFLRLTGAGIHLLGGLGLLFTAVWVLPGSTVRLAVPAMIACLLGSLVMFSMAGLQYLRKRPPYWLPAILTAVLMLDTVAQCQAWGTQPQVLSYFFPLMASVSLVLSAYHQTARCAGQGNPRSLAFFSQSALFFCCLSLYAAQWPLYLGMLFWSAGQFYPCICVKKEA